jgi:hypothetical protein
MDRTGRSMAQDSRTGVGAAINDELVIYGVFADQATALKL